MEAAEDPATGKVEIVILDDDEKTETKGVDDDGEEAHLSTISTVTCAICLDIAESPATLSGCPTTTTNANVTATATRHTFCLACIEQWSKVTNRCPLCKRPFDAIIHRGGDGNGDASESGAVVVIPVEARSPRIGGGGGGGGGGDDDDDDDEAAAEAAALAEALDQTVCRVCGCGDDEANTLLCDGQGLGGLGGLGGETPSKSVYPSPHSRFEASTHTCIHLVPPP